MKQAWPALSWLMVCLRIKAQAQMTLLEQTVIVSGIQQQVFKLSTLSYPLDPHITDELHTKVS